MSIKRIAVLFIIFALLLSGCGNQTPTAQAPAAATTAPAAPSDTPLPTDTATPTVNTAATQSAQQTAAAQATADAATKAAADKQTQAVLDKNATATAKEGAKQTEKAQVLATSTAEASSFLEIIQKLNADGTVGSTEGDFQVLNDLNEEMAMLNYFAHYETGYSGENFVFSSDIKWSVASMSSDFQWSGCGLMFGRQDNDNFDMTFVGLDGMNSSVRWTNGKGTWLAQKHWGKPDLPEGSAKLMIAGYAQKFKVWINDTMVSSFYDSRYRPGEIMYSVVSGTNKDYGIRCQMTNSKLFIFK